MKIFLIVLAVIVVIFAIILSLSAEVTVVFDNGWHTKVKVLFIEKDLQLSKVLSFLVAPEKAAQEVSAEHKEEKENKNKKDKQKKAEQTQKPQSPQGEQGSGTPQNPPKKNFIAKIFDDDGIVGIMLFVSNLLQTANSAVTTLIKGLHIYSLYVKMIIGGGEAGDIGQKYGAICGIYYPIKGFILNGMKVDQYDDYIVPDFIAPASEYEFQFIGSINVALILKVGLKAGAVFVTNLIKNK